MFKKEEFSTVMSKAYSRRMSKSDLVALTGFLFVFWQVFSKIPNFL
jgi:hypothetical protein